MLFKKDAEDVKQKVEEASARFMQRFDELHSALQQSHDAYDNRLNSIEVQLQQLTVRFAGEAEKLAVKI